MDRYTMHIEIEYNWKEETATFKIDGMNSTTYDKIESERELGETLTEYLIK